MRHCFNFETLHLFRDIVVIDETCAQRQRSIWGGAAGGRGASRYSLTLASVLRRSSSVIQPRGGPVIGSSSWSSSSSFWSSSSSSLSCSVTALTLYIPLPLHDSLSCDAFRLSYITYILAPLSLPFKLRARDSTPLCRSVGRLVGRSIGR